ncbi:TetR/AcrR family transcriptional regulator [Desulfobotulus sp. H1]|uniref:TetR/AcrR family transcriptional regulator n=1 Tax=Desulfobotulus pelophilus TaxID=2823377 RepID=A0ABT3N9J4_9BACT|nr:TetR/AcrR family transcriptional regulator [Desulfobotulus pelophilus]MCW7754138.1 TetR/AcrR family transcriptional regulator [Desulfobotulus pelophilus]
MSDRSTFMKLREDEREVRKSLIINAAMKLFEEKSFHDIGMRDIASEAGVSAASIYRYFPSRDDLFVEALIQDINSIEGLLEQRLSNGGTIEDLAVAVVDYLIDNEATFQMMCHFMIRGEVNTRALKKFNAVQRYFLKMFDEMVKRAGGAENIRFFSHAFFASLAGVVMTFRNYPGRNPDERRRYMHKLALLIMREGNSLDEDIFEKDLADIRKARQS